MIDDDDATLAQLEEQLATLAASGAAFEALTSLAEAVFPEGGGFGGFEARDRTLWPEADRPGRNGTGTIDARLERSETRLETLLEQIPAIVFTAALGTANNEVYISPQIERLLGFTQQEWLSNPLLWYTQLHPDDHDVVIEAFTHGVQTGGPFKAEVRFFARDGHEVWIAGEAVLLKDVLGRPAFFQGVGFDVTASKTAAFVKAEAEHAAAEAQRARAEAERARAEALAEANTVLSALNAELDVARIRAEEAAAARSAFLATMSHELRTPMNSVVVLSQLLGESALNEPQREMVRNIELSADHLMTLINSILDLSRLRSSRLELDRESFMLEEWVEGCLEIVAPKAADKDLALFYEIEPGTPAVLSADDVRLRQVLVNLVGNAVKFTDSGHIAVTVGAQETDEGQWLYSCSVQDTGIGIDPQSVDELFVEFQQADIGIGRRYGGSGLGLAISRSIVELHGGTITVASEPGSGSTFTFTFVASASREPTAIKVPVPALVGVRMLVVDNSALELDNIVSLCRSVGVNVVGAASLASAFELLDGDEAFDLVVIDRALGDDNGAAIAPALAARPNVGHVAVLSYSVYASQVRDLAGPDVGFLVKPLRHTNLAGQLLSLMAERSPVGRGAAATGAASDPVTSAPAGTAVQQSQVGRGALRVLIADDNEFNQQLMVMLLDSLGIADADVVDSGDGAIDAVTRTTYDVVLMDVMMPVTDGLTATRTIRALGDEIHQPYVVALTANALPGDREACVASGMDAYLSKPISKDELASFLDRLAASLHEPQE